MRASSRLAVVLSILLSILAVGLGSARADGDQAQLVGRAVLPANTLTDGEPAGRALGSGATLNGIKIPFDSQPVGTISAILPGEYPGTWLVLFDGRFDTTANSSDYLLRIYTFELDMRRASSGSGQVSLLNWQHLADPDNNVSSAITNAATRTRYLTGADFSPRAFQQAASGAFWVADEKTPALLRFDQYGKLAEPPIPVEGGALQGMGIFPDRSALLLALKSGSQVRFKTYDLTTRAFTDLSAVYPLNGRNHNIGGLSMINSSEALIIEFDAAQGARSSFKGVFLINLQAGQIQKQRVADLLNLADPSGLSTDGVFRAPAEAIGLGNPFSMPFGTITAMYPMDEQTLLIANNNRVPFGLGRSTSEADATEFIAVRLVQPLALDAAFQRPLR